MEKFTYINNSNGAFIDNLYEQYLLDPDSIDSSWGKFFEGYELGSKQSVNGHASKNTHYVSDKEVSVVKLINAYRNRGHLLAKTNPIRPRRSHRADLELQYFGLTDADLDIEFEAGNEIRQGKTSLRNILQALERTYCGHIGVEFRYIRDENLRQWLYKKMEPIHNEPNFDTQKKRDILAILDKAVTFESFLQKKYVGKKRFSLEGLESLIPALDALVSTGAELGAEEFVLGMAHRGRLNVLVNVFQKSYENVFSEFEEAELPSRVQGDGDVKYHLGQSSDVVTPNGKKVHLSLTPNPSHLEAVNPVVEGMVRAKRDEMYGADFDKIVPVLIHGDAAIAGQGVVYEVINLSRLHGFQVGGTVHIVTNNQVGFTANYMESRSTVYCTDIAKVTESPVFHVNGDDPIAVVHAIQMAIEIRQTFHIDVYIDIVGYRRYGHNEGDEPRFTQPILYEKISKHPSIRDVFLQQLISDGTIAKAEADALTKKFNDELQEQLEHARNQKPTLSVDYLHRNWSGFRWAEAKDFEVSTDTGVDKKKLDAVAKALIQIPKNFNLFTKMQKILKQRESLYFEKNLVDWGLAELLSFGSLLAEGHPVRITGQDSQRGTFAHRHSVIKDMHTEEEYIPLNKISKDQAPFRVFNSHLSEYAVLGFEYGYSVVRPQSLVIWEGQFGDFSNGSQIIIDQFISAAESKWQRMSGLVMLLPHGYEGQGPEHSSARLERYLQLCAENNMYVVNVTTPANFFHLLRRQIHNAFRKPLIVMSPKSLLRHPKVVSSTDDLVQGNFKEIMDDESVDAKKVKRVLLCSGKVYYELLEYRDKKAIKDVAIVRLEQIYPIAGSQIKDLLSKYKKAEWMWVQEEPENMGAWTHIMRHLPEIPWKKVSRKEAASPATGNSKIHKKNQEFLIQSAFK